MPSHPADPMQRRRLLTLLPTFALLGAVPSCAPMGTTAYGSADGRRIITAVNFDLASSRIRVGSDALLDNAAMALNDPQLGALHFEINGHTDISGRLGYNVALSMLRATAVADYLSARGVPRERMRPQGFGPLQPFDLNDPRSPANRRVEIVALR